MTAVDANEDALPATAWFKSTLLKRLAFVAGALLLIAAIVVVWRQHDAVEQAWARIERLPRLQLAGLLGLVAASVLLNLVLTGLLFHVLTSRVGRVGVVEMQALIAASTLLNYLPLRPGLVGRVAYHRAANQIPVRASVVVLFQAIGISLGVALYAAGAALASIRMGMDPRLLAIAPLPLLLGGFVSRGLMRVILLAALLRYAELAVIAARYWAAFSLIGSPVEAMQAVAFACVSVITAMVPLLSNGLGAREWAVGLLAPVLSPYHMSRAMTADLLIRAVEVVVVSLVGALGMAYLAHRARRARA